MSRTDLNSHFTKLGFGTYTEFQLSTGSQLLSNSYSRESLKLDEIRISSSTPGFRTLKRVRESLPVNPFTYEKVVHSYPYGSIHRTMSNIDRDNVWSGVTLQPFPFSFRGFDTSESTLDSRARNKVLSEVKSQKVNLLQVLGERRQTATLLLETADRLAQAMRAAKNGNLSLAAKNLAVPYAPNSRRRTGASHQLANDWLALKFGWEPLLSDIKGAAEFLASKKFQQEPRARASSSDSTSYSQIDDLTGSWGPPTKLRQFGTQTVKYVLYFIAENEVLKDLSSLGVTNIPSALYQLTPWSFVLDYFVRLGEFIDLIDAGYGLHFEKGSRTLFSRETMLYECSGSRYGDDGSLYWGTSKASSKRVYCNRTVLSSFPAPSITLGSGLSGTRPINALSLLRQRLRG